MSSILYFTDEDVYAAIAVALRRAGIDAISTPDVNRRGETDESQLRWSSDHGRVIVTFNVAHFAQLHRSWMRQLRHHAGIIVSSQRPIGDTMRRLLRLADALESEEMLDRLEFLGDW